MGNFVGHVLPGSMLLFFGLWWTWGLGRLAASPQRRRRQGKEPVGMRVALPPVTPGGAPLDPLIRLGLSLAGAAVEVHSALGYPRLSVADIQHVTMYSAFALAAVVDLLVHYRFPVPHSLTLPVSQSPDQLPDFQVPLGTDYFLSSLCFLSEGLLFYFHIQHQGPFEQKVGLPINHAV